MHTVYTDTERKDKEIEELKPGSGDALPRAELGPDVVRRWAGPHPVSPSFLLRGRGCVCFLETLPALRKREIRQHLQSGQHSAYYVVPVHRAYFLFLSEDDEILNTETAVS